ncbi:hypothetical protein GobsT_46970 [Gemmata obscuriglobus]|nr:hypothetical protein GobsT_46970 [Gemmata obscuriglobus]VTS09216.1 unnamed protein product [Gemmata obscuriglobus UQM 2246]
MRPRAARIGGPSPVAFTRGEVATTLRPPADPRRLQPPHGGGRTNSSPAPPSHDERCVTIQRAVSGAAPGSARCRPRFRATRRAPRICGCPRHRCDRAECYRLDAPCPGPSRATPTATRGDEPRPYPRAPRGAPPTRTAVSPHTAGHAQPHLAATSRASTDRHHAKPDTRDSPPRTTRSAPPHAPSCPRGCRTKSSPAPPSSEERCVTN